MTKRTSRKKEAWGIKTILVGLVIIIILFLVYVAVVPVGEFKMASPSQKPIASEKIVEQQQEALAPEVIEPFEPVKFFGSVDVGRTNTNNVEQKVRDFLLSNNQEFGIEDDEIILNSIKQDGKKYFVSFVQEYNEIPVYSGRVTVFVNNDKIAYVKSNYYPNIEISTTPKLSEQEIQTNTITDFIEGYYDIRGEVREYDFSEIDVSSIKESELVIYPFKNRYYLTWMSHVSSDEFDLTIFVDTSKGNIIDVKDNRIYYSVSGTVTGLEWEDPFTAEIQLEKSFAHEYVYANGHQEQTNENGFYYIAGLSGESLLESSLNGPWVHVYNNYPPDSYHNATFFEETIHNWSWEDEDTSYLDEESNVFYHVNNLHDYFAYLNENNTEMNFTMYARVNSAYHCNAGYNTQGLIHFGQAGEGCESTGVINDVVYHEYGHGIVHELDPSLLSIGGYWDQSGNIHEGLADYWACTMNDNPNMGEGFYQGDPTPLRICNSTDQYPEDYHPEPHSGCQIISGALWDIREVLGKEYLDQLIIDALRIQPIDFSELVEDLLIADDNNTNLTDGTPNIETICTSFAFRHGVWTDVCAHYTPYVYLIPNEKITYSNKYDVIELMGYATGSESIPFERYDIIWGVGKHPMNWYRDGISLVDDGFNESIGDLLGTFDTRVTTEPGWYTISLTGYFEGYMDESRWTIFIDSYKQGWPIDLSDISGEENPSGEGSITISDINEDGNEDVIVYGTHNVMVFNSDGTMMDGWPQKVGCYHSNSKKIPPSVEDIDGDGQNEILVPRISKIGFIDDDGLSCDYCAYAWESDGTNVTGWPIKCEDYPDDNNVDLMNSVITFIDVNDDGKKEAIANYKGKYQTYYPATLVFYPTPDLPVTPLYTYSGHDGFAPTYLEDSPAVGDVDCDGNDEIVVLMYERNETGSYYSSMYVLSEEGELEYLATDIGNWIYANVHLPVLADLDDDCDLEIAYSISPIMAGIIHHDGTPYNDGWIIQSDHQLAEKVSVNKHDENNFQLLVGGMNGWYNGSLNAYDEDHELIWSVPTNGSVRSQPTFADINDDEEKEIFITTYEWMVYGFTQDGEILSNFPKKMISESYSLFQNAEAVIGDLDNDGNPEIIATDNTPMIYVWELDTQADLSDTDWPMFQYDEKNRGSYPHSSCGNVLHGECSPALPQYCQNGELIDNCRECGCPSRSPYCRPSGVCRKTAPEKAEQAPGDDDDDGI
ncbi:hypothetical protein ACFLQN_02660 [Candidatus Aenigmatarchaeota archaeon]